MLCVSIVINIFVIRGRDESRLHRDKLLLSGRDAIHRVYIDIYYCYSVKRRKHCVSTGFHRGF